MKAVVENIDNQIWLAINTKDMSLKTPLSVKEATEIRDKLSLAIDFGPVPQGKGRKAKKITIDELKKQLQKAMEKHPDYNPEEKRLDNRYAWKELTPTIEKDLSKVNFDMENVMDETDDTHLGYQMIGNLAVYALEAGGDWEFPVYFIIYSDGKKLRGYIPKDGNAWNYDTKQALGNDEEADNKFLRKFYKHTDEREYEASDGDGMVDRQKTVADILQRITVE